MSNEFPVSDEAIWLCYLSLRRLFRHSTANDGNSREFDRAILRVLHEVANGETTLIPEVADRFAKDPPPEHMRELWMRDAAITSQESRSNDRLFAKRLLAILENRIGFPPPT